jgi:hypothetical protein
MHAIIIFFFCKNAKQDQKSKIKNQKSKIKNQNMQEYFLVYIYIYMRKRLSHMRY